MKSILLTSTALVAFAGAAAADGHAGVAFSGSATLGYNDNEAGDHDGFYADMNLDVTMSAELDNGVTVSASADVDELDAEDQKPGGYSFGGVTLTVASEMTTLVYGDTEHAAKNMWSSVGSMDNDTFRTQDGEPVLRGEVTLGSVETQLSYGVDPMDQAEMLSLGAKGTFGAFNVSAVYQEANTTLLLDLDDNGTATQNEVFGITAGGTFAGFDVAVGYAENDAGSSTGVSLGYTVGPVALSASYVMEDEGDDNWDVSASYSEGAIGAKVYTDESDDWGAEFSYDVGNGLVLYAGLDDAGDDVYAGGTYDLGGGGSLLIAYAGDDDDDEGDDEIGPNDWQEGVTVAVSFSF